MLLHSKTLYRLYPEQTWLANLQKTSAAGQETDNEIDDAPKFCKPQNSGYRLRQLQAEEMPATGLDQLKNILGLRKAS